MPLLGNFAAQSKNRKKGLCLRFRCFACPGCSTWSFCAPVQAFFACSEFDNNLVIVDLFDRCPRIERRRTNQQWTTRQATLCMFIRSFRQIERKKKKTKVSPVLRPPFNVSGHSPGHTTTKTRWQISSDLDLCPVKSSSLNQAQKGQKKWSLSCRGRAAKFPSRGIISWEIMPPSCKISYA